MFFFKFKYDSKVTSSKVLCYYDNSYRVLFSELLLNSEISYIDAVIPNYCGFSNAVLQARSGTCAFYKVLFLGLLLIFDF